MQAYVNEVFIVLPNSETFRGVEFRVVRVGPWFFISLAQEYLQLSCWFWVVECEATTLVDTTESKILILIFTKRDVCWLRWKHFNDSVSLKHTGKYSF